jgi:phospholipase/carboxylesterase
MAFATGCDRDAAFANDGRLNGRPRAVTTTTAADGALGLDRNRDALLRLPARTVTTPVPLLVLLHGAGGSGEGVLDFLGSAATGAGVAVLAPDSRDSTWDAVRGGFGRDVTFIDRALGRVFETVSVDPARVAIGGFSDGATYAISLGLINGDLFPRVIAFSPGFVVGGAAHGAPQFFVSHGRSDPILPIDRCSRIIVPGLRRRGYVVTFHEFDGGHEVPEVIARDAMQWIARI